MLSRWAASAVPVVLLLACSARPSPRDSSLLTTEQGIPEQGIPEQGIPEPGPSASSNGSASASLAAGAPSKKLPPPSSTDPIVAFTDPGALVALAKDCRWEPPTPTAPGESSPLSCDLHMEQSCNWSECDSLEEKCLPTCTTECGTCKETCASSCDSCKKRCNDDHCRTECAKECGGCRQTCLVEKDKCATGRCGEAVAACGKQFYEDWQKSPCIKLQGKFTACVEACVQKNGTNEHQGSSCQDSCEQRVLPNCSRFFSYYRIY